MFCYQCEQTAKGTGCDQFGICGKSPQTSNLQDYLLWALGGISTYTHKGKFRDEETDKFMIEALFTTVTNVNFDAIKVAELIKKAYTLKEKAKKLYQEKVKDTQKFDKWDSWKPADKLEDIEKESNSHTLTKVIERYGEIKGGLWCLVLYGLKGTAAYADHAYILGKKDSSVFEFFHETIYRLANEELNENDFLGLALKVGEFNLKVMEMLDKGNTDTFGHPEPTTVKVSAVKGKAILVSGHDLKDLYELLKQTEGKNINVYTHGEMLPTLAYPELKKFKHLAGN